MKRQMEPILEDKWQSYCNNFYWTFLTAHSGKIIFQNGDSIEPKPAVHEGSKMLLHKNTLLKCYFTFSRKRILKEKQKLPWLYCVYFSPLLYLARISLTQQTKRISKHSLNKNSFLAKFKKCWPCSKMSYGSSHKSMTAHNCFEKKRNKIS